MSSTDEKNPATDGKKPTTKHTSLLAGVALIVFITLALAVYCGISTGEWMDIKGLPEARLKLLDLPKTIGPWETVYESTLDKESTAMLQVQGGNIVRRYQNQQTMAEVNLIMMVGPTGKVTAHTPEICFGGRDYTISGERKLVSIDTPAGDGIDKTEDSFWRIDFVNNAVRGETISFYYSINIGNSWIATEDPRTEFRDKKFAYKIQAEAYAVDKNDVVNIFLQDCLPTIRQHIMPCPDRWKPGF